MAGAADEQLLKDERHAEEDRERPPDDAGDGVGKDGERDALPPAVDRRETRCCTEHDKVHGEGRGQEGGRGAVEAGREHLEPEDVAADVRADVDGTGAVKDGLDEGREGAEHHARSKEGDALRKEGSQCQHFSAKSLWKETRLVREPESFECNGRTRVNKEVEV